MTSVVTEQDGVRAYGRMLNTGDMDEFLALASPQFRYSSQWVFEELEGLDAFLGYIGPKLETVRQHPEAKVFAELAEVNAFGHQHCLVIAQGARDELVATLLVSVEDGLITQAVMCAIPEPSSCKRLGVYPGIDD